MSTIQAFSTNLRNYRAARGMTQADLAERAGFNIQTISNYENGLRWPQADILDVLAKVLKVRPWQLLAVDGEGGAVPPDLIDHLAAAARAAGLKVSKT